ncbi:MAG: hypothetical protein L0Y72_14955 [Gemmataceae bacterium]|nr:hypothetical protein [Gemmataceae bacterium]MCI0740342.1 hypothetical protein [Gemmataceae bacterium]
MKHKHFIAVINSFNGRKPFRPFGLEMVSGVLITITHPETIFFRGEIAVVFDSKQGYQAFDSDSICRILDLPVS